MPPQKVRESEARIYAFGDAHLEYLRDEFARTALEKCVSLFFDSPEPPESLARAMSGWPWQDYDDLAQTCWQIADAMLRNRVKPETLEIKFTGSKTVARQHLRISKRRRRHAANDLTARKPR
jgi:hypothetical protein